MIKKGRAPNAALTYASAGIGATNHLAGEWFIRAGKLNATHIPYKGDAAAVADLMAGRVDFGFIAGVVALPQVKAGKLRLLASASATPGRGPTGIKTLREAGFKEFVAEPWNGVMGPAGIPAPIVAKLNAAINEIMKQKAVVDRLAAVEQYPLTGTPQQFTASIKEQSDRWRAIIKDADIKAE
ncbi:tripartite tricarboxylate transporter substrate binding protein (plasmid) [Cupriavidus necator]|uniref:Tripartite tricarboxylate transporter substrate binding protein n=1 Tax=Cupriavidus necator TaxID=106590 RepID=A0A1U9V3Y1_CUPNE|nr:tripartite tricarboxylate transporter substrate binding protein [Cupriavidus necator]